MIYYDNAATTPLFEAVTKTMDSIQTRKFGNPSALYDIGVQNRGIVEACRENVAHVIGCSPEEIYFTSGGTEGDNWAVKGTIKSGDEIVSSQIEHHAMLNSINYAKQYMRAKATLVECGEDGRVDVEKMVYAMTDKTKLMSLMLVNNEVGTIQDLKLLTKLAKKRNSEIIIHTDAVQAIGHILIDVEKLGVDTLCASAHKFGGPRGVGFMYVRKGTEIRPLIHGGGQERGLRGGTENVAGILGMSTAISLIEDANKGCKKLRNLLWDKIQKKMPEVQLNGSMANRIDSNLNIYIPGAPAQRLVMLLNSHDICVSAGSACSAGDSEPSHVLTAMGYDADRANCSIRISLGWSNDTSARSVDEFVKILSMCVEQLRGA